MCSSTNGVGFDVVVIGGVTTQLLITTSSSRQLPARGETLYDPAADFRQAAAGQGANQAVCAARLGAKTAILCKVGDDCFGRDHVANFRRENVDHRLVVVSRSAPTSVAHVHIDALTHVKTSVISAGANARLGVQEIFGAAPSHLTGAKVLLVGLEIAPEVALYALKLGSDHEMTTILTPTCALQDYQFDEELYSNCDWFVPNRRCVTSLFSTRQPTTTTTSSSLRQQQQRQRNLQTQQQPHHHYQQQHHHSPHPPATSSSSPVSSTSSATTTTTTTRCETIEDAKLMAKRLRERGCKNVIITVGAEGVVFLAQSSKVAIHIAAPPIDQDSVVDKSGAADAFAGSFAYFLARTPADKIEKDVEVVYDIISKSCAVATFSVQRRGTMSSFPSQADIKLKDLL